MSVANTQAVHFSSQDLPIKSLMRELAQYDPTDTLESHGYAEIPRIC